MNWKNFFIAFVVIYIIGGLFNFIVHEVLLGATYQSLSEVWRPDMDRLMWLQWVTPLFYCFFFVYIFAKGYLRYGLIIWAFMSIPTIYGQYMVYPLPYSLVLQWLIYDLVILIIIGIVVSLIYKPGEKKAKEVA
jgi:MFS superfamily sulfate permease-like transporter